MLEDFRAMTLTEVAKQVGSDPFEVMRVLVVARAVPDTLGFNDEQLAKLRQAMGKR